MEVFEPLTVTPSKQFKISLIGDGQVGKTSLRRRYLDEIFKASYIPTLGVDFAQKQIEVDDTPVRLVIWDIAGQPLFKNLRRQYYQGCSGLILVYSVADRETFDNASKWLVEAFEYMNRLPPLIVVGNKVDLRPSLTTKTSVSYEEGAAFAKRFSDSMNTQTIFIETSAKTGKNVDDAFISLVRLLLKNLEASLERDKPRLRL